MALMFWAVIDQRKWSGNEPVAAAHSGRSPALLDCPSNTETAFVLCLFLGALEETVYGQESHREKKTGGGLPGDWIGAVFLV